MTETWQVGGRVKNPSNDSTDHLFKQNQPFAAIFDTEIIPIKLHFPVDEYHAIDIGSCLSSSPL